MVPPQPYSGSPGCPPVTTTLSLGVFVGGVAPGKGWATVVASGSPTARVVPSQLVLLSIFRREIGFMRIRAILLKEMRQVQGRFVTRILCSIVTAILLKSHRH